ncbi:MAG TPA: hypothetical protein VLN90_09000 [Thioalkalivibrio sp.]|nr:hypothetical protein [Thioalkalivibrio sp.]
MDALPQVRLAAGPSDDERASACLFGLPSVSERDIEADPCDRHSPWMDLWTQGFGEQYTVSAGHGDELQPALCERLFRAMVAFMLRVEVIWGIELAEEEEDLHYFGAGQVFRYRSERSGLFVFRQSPGQWLQAGDLLGYLYNDRDGNLLEELRAPVPGLLAGLRRDPLVTEGALLALIHRRTL